MLLKTIPTTEPAFLQEGFTVRPAQMADLDALVPFLNDCAIAKIGRPDITAEEMTREWQTPGLDLAGSIRLVVSPDGRPAGYIEVWDLSDLPVSVWVWGRVHPDFEGLGIGSHLLDWAEGRARQAITRVPDDVRVVMHCGALSTYQPAVELLEDWGMALVRHFWSMQIALDEAPPEPVLAVGPESERPLVIRPFSELEGRVVSRLDVFRAIDEAFADHWGHVDEPEEAAFERWCHWTFESEEYDPSIWFLAMDGAEIAGLSLCRPKTEEDPEMGWLATLGVRRPWRQMGVGLALLHHTFGAFRRRGQKRVGLGVDAASLTGATRLYEKAGMHVYRQFNTYEKELRPGRDLSTQSVDE